MNQVEKSSRGFKGRANFSFYLIVGFLLLLVAVAASISLGAADMSVKTAWGALFRFNPELTEHQIIRSLRLPRTIASMIVGASLAICGAIMQGTTRNPLADSGLMGISSGATFAIACSLAFLPNRTYGQMMILACIGAAIATGLTYYVASRGGRGMSPERLVLAGLSISMLFGAFSSYLSIRFRLGQSLTYWSAGGTAGAKWNELAVISPLFFLGVIGSLILARSITVMSLGDEIATGLGLKLKPLKAFSTIIVLVLTGLSVIVVGPVAFVGLIVPHIVRYLVGSDYRYIIPASGVFGALFTVSADILGRTIHKPFEVPLGIIFSVIGVPYFYI